MERLVGRDLQAVLRAAGALPTRVALAIAAQAAAGLAAAHEAGIVHRDVKPANVFLAIDARGEVVVRVLDFGVACLTEDVTRAARVTRDGHLLGTPLYMAPEQAFEARAAGPASDVFSLGAVLYEMLAGRAPHAGHTSIARVILAALREPAPPIGRLVPHLAPRVVAIVHRALAHEPRARFANARTMEKALRAIVLDARLTRADFDGLAPGLFAADPPPAPGEESRPRSTSPLARSVASPVSSPPSMMGAAPGPPPSSRAPRAGGAGVRVHRAPNEPTLASPASPRIRGDRGMLGPRARAAFALALVLVALVTAFGIVAGRARIRRDANATGEGHARRTLAILGFTNGGADPADAWRGTAIDEMLRADLSAGEALRVVASDETARARQELGATDPVRFVAQDGAWPLLFANLHADLVVTGVFYASNDDGTLRIDLMLYDAARGAHTTAAPVLARVDLAGADADLFGLVARVGAALRPRLGLPDRSAAETAALRAALPAGEDAARFYAEGMRAQQEFQPVRARDLFARAVALAPDFALAHAALARAFLGLGHDEEAKAEAHAALLAAGALPREQKLWIEGQYHAAMRDWDKAAETYQALAQFFPDDLEYAVRLVQAKSTAGHASEALVLLEGLRENPAFAADPRLDFEETRLAHSTSDYRRCLAASERVVAKASERGLRFLAAQVGYYRGTALEQLSRDPEAIDVLERARGSALELGDRLTAGMVAAPLGRLLIARGELDAARALLDDARRDLAELGHANFFTLAVLETGIIDDEEGDLDKAAGAYEYAVRVYRELGMKHGLATSLPYLARARARTGDLARAARLAEELVELTRVSGRKAVEAEAWLALAEVGARRGDAAEREKDLDRALELARGVGNRRVEAEVLFARGESARARRAFAAARADLDAAWDIAASADEGLRAANVDVARARLALDQGRVADARALATGARKALDAMGAARARDLADETLRAIDLRRPLVAHGR
jgi:hypothetical protein